MQNWLHIALQFPIPVHVNDESARMRTLPAFILFVILLACQSRQASAAPIEVFANMFQEPKAWLDDTGMHGYVIETAEAILQDANIDYVWAGVPFARAMAQTKACKGLMVGVFRSPERQAFFLYSAPIVAESIGLVTRASEHYAPASAADLRGHSVTYLSGAVFGLSEADLIGARRDPQTRSDTMLKKLLAGHTDVVILSPREQVPVAARLAGIPMSKLTVGSLNVPPLDNHIVACKTGNYGPLLERINQSIAKLRANGALDHIMQAYRKF